MFNSNRRLTKEDVTSILSVSKPEIKYKLEELCDTSKQVETSLRETATASREAVAKLNIKSPVKKKLKLVR